MPTLAPALAPATPTDVETMIAKIDAQFAVDHDFYIKPTVEGRVVLWASTFDAMEDDDAEDAIHAPLLTFTDAQWDAIQAHITRIPW